MLKVLILTYNDPFAGYVLQKYFEQSDDFVLDIIESTSLIYKKKKLESIFIIFGNVGLKYFLYVSFYKVFLSLCSIFEFLYKGRKKSLNNVSLYILKKKFKLKSTKCDDLNSARFTNYIKSLNPDIIFSIHFTHIINKNILSIPEHGSINVHAALLPKHAGIAPAFWSLLASDEYAGVTIHYMDTKLDSGDIIVQEKIKISNDETFFSLNKKQTKCAANLLAKTIELIKKNSINTIIQSKEERIYNSWPNKGDVNQFTKKRKLISFKDIKETISEIILK